MKPKGGDGMNEKMEQIRRAVKAGKLTADGARKTVAEQHVGRHEWKPISADLSSWRGQRVKLYLVADCGPKNNTAGDWSAWGDLKLKFK